MAIFRSLQGGGHKAKKVTFPGNGNYFHPSIRRAIDIILQYFPRLVEEQGWFDDADAYKPFLDLLGQQKSTLLICNYICSMVIFLDVMEAVAADFKSRTNGLDRAEAVVSRLKNKVRFLFLFCSL